MAPKTTPVVTDVQGTAGGRPVTVEVVGDAVAPAAAAKVTPDQRIQDQDKDPSVRARTTMQEDLTTASQRRVNLIWEKTQAIIACAVTVMTLGLCALLVARDKGGEGAFLLVSNAFFLVIGTYFQRTNHVKQGGVAQHSEKTGER